MEVCASQRRLLNSQVLHCLMERPEKKIREYRQFQLVTNWAPEQACPPLGGREDKRPSRQIAFSTKEK